MGVFYIIFVLYMTRVEKKKNMKRLREASHKDLQKNHKRLRLTYFINDSIVSLFLTKHILFPQLDHFSWKNQHIKIYDNLRLAYGIIDKDDTSNFINAGDICDMVIIDSSCENIYPDYKAKIGSFIKFKKEYINSKYSSKTTEGTLNFLLREKLRYYITKEKHHNILQII